MPLFDSVRNFVQSPTETKVRQATDDNDGIGATGTLMNEISVLTYSSKTLKEIVQCLKKRLHGYGRKSTHKNCVHILKTLTLISYLINNGSNDFVAWSRSNISYFQCLRDFEVQNAEDEKMARQIILISNDLCQLINDDVLLDQRRNEVIQFRSSISSPGRKSTDNSHLKKSSGFGSRKELSTIIIGNRISSGSEPSTPKSPTDFPIISNAPNDSHSNTSSLDLIGRSGTLRRNTQEYPKLGPVKEEDSSVDSNSAINSSNNLFGKFTEANPFK